MRCMMTARRVARAYAWEGVIMIGSDVGWMWAFCVIND